ncbi:MAG: hypothetical protein LBT86_06295 [Deltaproteobacteria bacterium]|jgi:hypothetical protein|nr:hypothetical protein [Deltaproteobacteria bacterium]
MIIPAHPWPTKGQTSRPLAGQILSAHRRRFRPSPRPEASWGFNEANIVSSDLIELMTEAMTVPLRAGRSPWPGLSSYGASSGAPSGQSLGRQLSPPRLRQTNRPITRVFGHAPRIQPHGGGL